MKAAVRPLSRLLRDLFRLEPLEPRLLLSADPVLGAAQAVLAPSNDEQAAALLQAYSAKADRVVTPATGQTVLVTQGPARHAQADWLVIDASQLGGGNGTLVIGGPGTDARILVGEEGGPAVQLAELVLINPAGGKIEMQGELTGHLVTLGSGHTYIVDGNQSAASFAPVDVVEVRGGEWTMTATGVNGTIQIGNPSTTSNTITGDNDGVADRLVLRADGGIEIYNKVGGADPLESLTIGARTVGGTDLPSSVKFHETVLLNGDLVIDADSSATVTFVKQVTLTGGGSLRINGAGAVVFEGGLVLSGTSGGAVGSVLIEGNEIDFTGATESYGGAGTLTLRPATLGNEIELGSLGGPTGNVLNLTAADLSRLADGFSKIVIGHESGGHAVAGAGAVRVGAGSAPDPLVRDALEVYGGTITVADPSAAADQLVVLGTIKLDAVNDIEIRGAVIARGPANTGVSNITLYSESGAIRQVDSLDEDVPTAGEPLRGAALTVRAEHGILLPWTELATVHATNAGSGDLSITETATGGDIGILLLSQANNAGNLSLRTTSGAITVGGDGVLHAGTGLIDLEARGTLKALTVNEAVHSTGGAIRLAATGFISIDDGAATDGTVVTDAAADIDILSSANGIQQGGLVASAGGEVNLGAASFLTMLASQTVRSLDGVGNGGTVRLSAGTGNVTVATVEADGNIFVTAGAAILGVTSSNPHLDGETATVLLSAAAGIGTNTASGTLQTRVGTLAAKNTGSGSSSGIFVREATDLVLAGGLAGYALDAGGTGGTVSVVTTEGTLTVGQAVRSTGTVGHILLQAGETADGTAADLQVRADVSSSSGSISLAAADHLVVDDAAGGAPVVSSAGAGQFVDLRADGDVTLEGLARVAATSGASTVWLQAGGAAQLGVLDAGASGRVFAIAGTTLTDAQADDAGAAVTNITGSDVHLQAQAIGAAGALLDLAAANLAARSTAGGLFLSEADALAFGSIGAASSSRVSADGSIAAAAGVASLVGLDSNTVLVANVGGNLTVGNTVHSAGNLRLHAGGAMTVSATVDSATGHASVVAAGQLDVGATGRISTDGAGQALDLASTGGHLVMANGAVATTNAGTLRVQSGLTATLGRVDARSAADRLADSLAGQAAWGDVSVVAGGAILGNATATTPDIYARQLRLDAALIGNDPVNLHTEALRLGARTTGIAGDMFILEATALELGTTGAITAYRVDGGAATGAATEQSDATLAGLSTLTGTSSAIVLQTTAGSLSGGAGATVIAGGNILLRSGGAGSDLDLDAVVRSHLGHVSLDGGRDLLLDGGVGTLAGARSIDLKAAGAVTLGQGQSVSTGGGNVSIDAGGVVTLEEVDAGAGSVRVVGASIVEGDGAGADGEVDIRAAGLVLRATAGGIGAAGATLETQVATLTASATGGGIYLLESDGLTVDSVQVNVERVGTNAGAAGTAYVAQEDLRGTSVFLTSAAGAVTVNAGTAGTPGVASSAGPVRLQSGGGLQVSASVDAGTGSLSLVGGGAVAIGAASAVTVSGGSVDIESTGGTLTLAANAQATTSGGAIRARAQGDLQLSVLDARTSNDRTNGTLADQATWGNVSIGSTAGSISDHADSHTNVYAAALRLEAAGGIGASGQSLETEAQSLSARAGAGGVFLDEDSSIVVGQTAAISVARPDADGTVPGTPGTVGDALQSGIDSGGAAVLVAAGQLQTMATGAVLAAGNVLLDSGANLITGALVRSSGGHILLHSDSTVTLNGDVTTQAGGSTIAIYADLGGLTQAQGTAVTTSNGNVALVSQGGPVTLEAINAGTAALHIQVATLLDGDAAGDSEVDLTAGSIRLLTTGGGIGAGDNAIETDTALLAARGAGGGVFITEASAVTVGGVGNVLVQEVQAGGGATGVNHTGGSGLAGADVVLRTVAGALTLSGTGGSAAATGNLLLQAGGAHSLAVSAGVTASAAGSMSLVAGEEVAVAGGVSVTGGGTLDVRAGRVDFQQNSTVATQGGDVAIVATGTVTIESIDAGAGGVRIAANRVEDGETGDTEADIVAGRLAISATQYIGAVGNALEASVGTASLRAGTIASVSEATALTLDTVSVTVNHVGESGAAAAQGPASQSNSTGTVFLLRAGGSIDSTAAGGAVTAGTGNLLVQANGASSDLTLRAEVRATVGSISLHAGRAVQLDADVVTVANGATVDVLASGGNLLQSQGTNITTNAGHVSLQSATGTVTIERISAGAGRVNLAGTAILDGDADGDSEADVLATGVLFAAGTGGVGSSANAIETSASTLSARALAGGSIFLAESDNVSLDTVAYSVNRIGSNGSSTSQAGSQGGVAGADIVVRTLAGSLAVVAGSTVAATGNLLLEAGGAGDLTVGAAVGTSGGSLSLVAGGAMNLHANVGNTFAGAAGTVDLRAGGAFTQSQGTAVTTAGGHLALQAGGVATIDQFSAGTGDLRVSATGIVDSDAAGSDDVDFTASALKLEGTGGIGASGAAVEIAAATLAARATGGGIYLTESNALAVGSVAVDVRNVAGTGSAALQAVADSALAGVTGQSVVLQTLNGLLAIDAAVAATGGNLLLSAGGAGADLSLAASVSAAGAMSLAANRNVSITSSVSTTGGAANTLDVVAANGTLTAGQGSALATAGANVLLQANGTLTLESVNAGAGAVRLAGAAIVDGDTAPDEAEVDVVAAQLQIAATGAIGAVTNALETTVATLSAAAVGGIFLGETDALAVDGTSVSVNRVAATGTATATTATTQADITDTGNGVVVLRAGGDIDLPAGADVRTGLAGTITITSLTGHVLMHATTPGQSVIQTGSGDIRIQAKGDIRPGALLTTGQAYVDSEDGAILIAGDLQRDGEDIDLLGDDLVITVPVESDGATLRIGPLTTGTAVVIGGPAPGPGALHVDDTEVGLLQDGFAQIVIGSTLDNQSVQIEGTGTPVVFLDPLVLVATADGGNVSISGGLEGTTLTVQDSGTRTTFTDATVDMAGAISVQDQVIVAGANVINAGTGGAAGLTFTETITGDGGAADTLALSANGGDVRLDKAVTGLDGLTITDAADLTFGADVSVDGDLVIEATGTITFTGQLTLGNGGELIVRGGGRVVFLSGADLGTGNVTLEVDSLDADGGAGSITGSGELALSGATAGTSIHLGAGAGAGGLVVTADALAALGDGFSVIRFGSGSGAGAGAVTVGSADLRNTDAAIEIRGSSIAVAATGGGGLQVDTGLDLQANGTISTAGRIVAGASADITLTSDAGSVVMGAGSSIGSEGGAIELSAAGSLAVATLDARGTGGGAGSVKLSSAAGVIADANGDTTIDIYAQSLDFDAPGPGGGDVLEVAAPIIRVDPGAGTLVRESSPGVTYYKVVAGGTVSTALAAYGPSVRVTRDPAGYVGDPDLLEDMGLSSPLEPTGFESASLMMAPSTFSGFSALGAFTEAGAGGDAGGFGSQVSSYLAGGAGMVAPELSLSQRLLADSGLSFASGQPADVESGVDWWLESVVL